MRMERRASTQAKKEKKEGKKKKEKEYDEQDGERKRVYSNHTERENGSHQEKGRERWHVFLKKQRNSHIN